MRIFTLLALFIVACSSLNFAQEESENFVPEEVQKKFSRKFPRSENVAWNKVENNYKADFFFDGRGTYAEFSPDGEWVMTITDLDVKALYPPIQNYLDENFKKDKIILAEKAEKADRQDYYYVQLLRKDEETKEEYVAELFFDKTGRIEQVKLPEGVNEMTIVGIDDPNSEIPEDVIDSWQKRFPRAEEIDWTTKPNPSDSIDLDFIATFVYRDQPNIAEFLPNGDWVETRTEYDPKDLYGPIVSYLDEHHKGDEIIIAEKVTRKDRNDYYYVKLIRDEKGQTEPYEFELFFSKSGQIEKVIRPEILVNQYLLTVDVPDDVARKFKGRFASAEEVTWETSKGNWIASFIYRDLKTTATFSDSADWVQTVQVLDLKDMYNPIQRDLDENHGDYKVIYAEKVTRKDRNNYYYLELTGKKKNVSPQEKVLYYDRTGRPKDDIPER
ncbi:MAG: PepSY-like domain-containing protein [Bacteroidales bacterium]|nr:PepSY-like domain-containing protein [Bacteroidales bacterium]